MLLEMILPLLMSSQNGLDSSKLSRTHCLTEERAQRLIDSSQAGSWQAAWRLQSFWGFCRLNQDSMQRWSWISDSLGNYWPRHFRLLNELKEPQPDCNGIKSSIETMRWTRRDTSFVRDSMYLDMKWRERCAEN